MRRLHHSTPQWTERSGSWTPEHGMQRRWDWTRSTECQWRDPKSGSKYCTSAGTRLDVHARGFWERQRSAFFDVRVCRPNAASDEDLTPQQIYRRHANEKKRLYGKRVTEIEQATFTPLVFTTTGGMGEECLKYHSRLAELITNKKGEVYSHIISWIRAKISFSILRSALLCLRGSRTLKRVHCIIKDIDLDIETAIARIH